MSGATWIDVGMRVRGDLSGPGDVKISGHFQGRIHVSGSVWVADGAQVKADVVAGRVRVDGTLEGTIRASREASVGPSGKLVGDVYGMLAVDEGGVFQGRIIPGSDDRLTTTPGGAPPTPRKLKVPPAGGRLGLPTKRRVRQPSAERAVLQSNESLPIGGPPTTGSATAVSSSGALPAATGPQRPRPQSSGRLSTISDSLPAVAEGSETARARTPRRLVAQPRRPKPLVHEAPPRATSGARLPPVRDEDLERGGQAPVKPPPAPRPKAPSAPPKPPEPPPPQDLLGKPSLASSPAMSSIVDEWFEDEDFLVKRARDSGEVAPPAPSSAPKRRKKPTPSKRRSPRKKKPRDDS